MAFFNEKEDDDAYLAFLEKFNFFGLLVGVIAVSRGTTIIGNRIGCREPGAILGCRTSRHPINNETQVKGVHMFLVV